MIVVVYMLAFMLIPIWIPVIAATAGFVHDRVRSSARSTLDLDHLRN